jgi:hypothetical protein
MSEIDEILERHPTTCSYEEDARYIYPETTTGGIMEYLYASVGIIALFIVGKWISNVIRKWDESYKHEDLSR